MKTQPISTKLYGAFGLMLALLCVLAISSVLTLNRMKDLFDVSSRITTRKIILAGELDTSESDMFAAQRGMIMNTLAGRSNQAEEAYRKFEQAAEHVKHTLDETRPLLSTAEGKRIFAIISDGANQWRPLAEQIHRECQNNKTSDAIRISDNTVAIHEAIGKATDDFSKFNYELVRGGQTQSDDSATTAKLAIFVLVGLSAASGGLVFLVVRQIVRRLTGVALSMTDGADQVASASRQVSSASQSLAQGASEQAASLEETSASAEEITSLTRKNAENAGQAAQLMREVDESVTSGNVTIDQMVASMQSINESSAKISKIIRVIDEIAFQTNILALNAAVEAARAGESGMGFAVVADEVRNLAQRSARAAKDTASLIEESMSRSQEGSLKLDNVTVAMHSITGSSSKVRALVDQVNSGSSEQARGIEQIGKAISQMEKITQQNASSAEESASASEELSAQADVMRTSVQGLRALLG